MIIIVKIIMNNIVKMMIKDDKSDREDKDNEGDKDGE